MLLGKGMPMKPIVLFYASETGFDAARLMPALSQQGYAPVHCPDTTVLRAKLHEFAAVLATGSEPIMVVLAATPSRNHAAAGILAAWPQVGVLVQLDACDDATLIGALQLGIDAWCPRSCSPNVLVLALHNLQRRLERALSSTVRHQAADVIARAGAQRQLHAPVRAQWLLCDLAWRLQTPTGQNVRLTSAERGFMLKLTEHPQLSASHAQLFQALGCTPGSPTAKTRLGVLVSRLRQKVAQHGIQLPLKSLHSWGYMFAGEIVLQNPPDRHEGSQ